MQPEDLKQFALFDGMTDQQLTESAGLFEQIKRMAGERVTREDDYGYSLFLILSGSMRVEVDDKTIAELGAGDHFGEVSLVTGKKRNATVRANETCQLAKIMVWDFNHLTEHHPELAARIKAVAAERTNE